MLFLISLFYTTGFIVVGAITISILQSTYNLKMSTKDILMLSLRNSALWPYWALRFILTLKCGIKEGILNALRKTRINVMLSKETDQEFNISIEQTANAVKHNFQIFIKHYIAKYGSPSPSDYETIKTYFVDNISKNLTWEDTQVNARITDLLAPKKKI